MQLRTSIMALAALVACAAPAVAQKFDYRLLATMKTSTMEKELNQAGAEGYRFGGAMGGESAAGGKEVIVSSDRHAAECLRPDRREARLIRIGRSAGAGGDGVPDC